MIAGMMTTASLPAGSPVVIQQPVAAKYRVGEVLNLDVGATGSGPLTYTWFRGRTQVASGPSSLLSISPVQGSNAGWYWARVSNVEGATGSDAVMIRVATYGEWPVAQGGNGHGYEVVQIGELENDWAQMFRDAMASGGYLVSYHSLAEENFANGLIAPAQLTRLIGLFQPNGSFEPANGWQWMSGEPVTYTRWNANEPNDGGNGINSRGNENLVGINATGSWNDIHGGSRGYVMEYPTQLVLYASPTNTVVSGYQSVALRVGAASKSPVSYTWYLDGEEVPGVSGNTLPTAMVLPSGGTVYVRATDGINTISSVPVQVIVAPVFSQSPANQVVYQGESATFTVGLASPGPFLYQWYRNGTPVIGGNGATLTLTGVTAANQGSYEVEVSNNNGSARSAPAELVVIPPNGRLIRHEDFEQGAQPGWSIPVSTVAPAEGRRFLGEFHQESVQLDLTDLPAHDQLTISFDLIIRGFWKGNTDPDDWSFAVDGFPALRTTFSSFTTQSYPGNYFQASNPAGTGSRERNTLGHELVYSNVSMLEDSRYRITVTTPHFTSQATLVFGSTLSTYYEAGWSLDNLVVLSSSADGSRLVVSPQAGTGKLNLRVQSLPGSVVTIRRTSDFAEWTFFQDVFNQTGETVIEADPAQLGSPTFFRAEGN